MSNQSWFSAPSECIAAKNQIYSLAIHSWGLDKEWSDEVVAETHQRVNQMVLHLSPACTYHLQASTSSFIPLPLPHACTILHTQKLPAQAFFLLYLYNYSWSNKNHRSSNIVDEEACHGACLTIRESQGNAIALTWCRNPGTSLRKGNNPVLLSKPLSTFGNKEWIRNFAATVNGMTMEHQR